MPVSRLASRRPKRDLLHLVTLTPSSAPAGWSTSLLLPPSFTFTRLPTLTLPRLPSYVWRLLLFFVFHNCSLFALLFGWCYILDVVVVAFITRYWGGIRTRTFYSVITCNKLLPLSKMQEDTKWKLLTWFKMRTFIAYLKSFITCYYCFPFSKCV